MISRKIPKFPTTSLLLQVFLNNPIFSQNFSLVDFPFCPDWEKFFPFGIFFLLFPKISQNRISTKILREEIMISRKIPKFLKISHHKFTSRKLFPIFSQKILKQEIKFSQIFPDFLILGNISHFV